MRFIETAAAEPLSLTARTPTPRPSVAGLAPKTGGRRHQPTEAARQLLVEIMIDRARADGGEKSKWAGRMSAPAITLELDRRKGNAGGKKR